MANVRDEYEDHERKLDLLNTAEQAIRVEKERIKRRLRRLDRLDFNGAVPLDLHPSWETKVRNVTAIAAVAQVATLMMQKD